MEQRYLDAFAEAEEISRHAQTTYKDALERSGTIQVLEEPRRVTVVVFQSGIIQVFVDKREPALFQEIHAEIKTRRKDTIRRVDILSDGKVIPYCPK